MKPVFTFVLTASTVGKRCKNIIQILEKLIFFSFFLGSVRILLYSRTGGGGEEKRATYILMNYPFRKFLEFFL